MNLQVIKSYQGQPEYVLLPVSIYHQLRTEIDAKLNDDANYVPFDLEDYLDNPVALSRMKAHITQEDLAKEMDVSQAYISQLEVKEKVTAKTLEKVNAALAKLVKAKKNHLS